MYQLPETMTLAEIVEGHEAVSHARARVAQAIVEMQADLARARAELVAIDDVLRALDAKKLALKDHELTGHYEVTHGTYGSTPKGGVVHLHGAEARRALEHGVVKSTRAPEQEPIPEVLDEEHEEPADGIEKDGIDATADGTETEHELDGKTPPES